MEYIIINESPDPMPFIWAAHPLFEIEKGTQIFLPLGVKTIANTLNMNNRLGKKGSVHKWPETVDRFGNPYDISFAGQRDQTCDKFYVRESIQKGEIRLCHFFSKKELSIRFPIEQVRYVGIWINRGGYEGQFNVCPKPATGALDDLYLSYFMEECSVLPPKRTYKFHIEFTVR